MNPLFISLAAPAGPTPPQGVLFFARDMFWDAVVVAFLFITIWVMIRRATAGLSIPPIRKLAGLDALDEAIGRSTEMGRPIHYSPGMSEFASTTYAGLAVLGYVAKMAAEYDTKLVVTVRRPLVHPVAQEIVKQAYLEACRPDAYNEDDVRFVGEGQFVYTGAVMGLIQREKPAANLMIGYWMAEALEIAEAGAEAGCIQVGANTNVFQIHFFIVTCDYTLIGEELFAAAAYLSKEPRLVGTVVAQDIAKIATLALIVFGTVWASVTGSAKPLVDFLSL